jgi:ATP-binding cassette subfamily B protein
MVQQVLDRGVLGPAGYRADVVWGLSAVAIAVVVVVMVASRATYIRLVRTAEAVLLGSRVRAFEHIHRLSLAEHTGSRKGVLVSRVTSDVEQLAAFAQWGALAWVINSAVIVGTLVVMAVYSWQLTLVVIGVHLPLIPFLRWVQRRQFLAYARVRDRVAETLGHTSEAVSGAAVIKAYDYTETMRQRLDESVDQQYRASVRAHVWFTCMLPAVDLVSSISLAAAIGVGVWWAGDLGLAVGELVAFIFLVNLLLNPISELGEVLDRTQTALAAWWKVMAVEDIPVEIVEPDPGEELPPGPLSVALEHVDFSYRSGGRVLHDLNLVIPAEANVAVVGETGSGKTTFARLVARFADPTGGIVRVGGIDTRRISPESRHRGIRMVPQDGFLFDTTIEANIRYGRPGATRDDVERAIELLGLGWWVDGSADGLDTVVGERGGRLSVGERQLVALARAQVADPGLLLLDEATSAIDPETEDALADALARLAVGRTMISIAHRLSTAERADLVLVFANGRLVEQGPHAELVSRGGAYATLHESWIGNTRQEGGSEELRPGVRS